MKYPYTLESIQEQRIVEIAKHPNYFISSFGYVFRREHVFTTKNGHQHTLSNLVLTRYIDSLGYWAVDIKGVANRLHRLLAKAFIPNPEDKATVNHKDGNKWNMSLDNLEWATQSENNQHAYDVLGKIGAATGKPSPLARPIYFTDTQTGVTKRYPSVHTASVHEAITRQTIYQCLKAKRLTRYGKLIRYA